MLEVILAIGLLLLCLYAIIDKLDDFNKDLHISKEGLEVVSNNNTSNPQNKND